MALSAEAKTNARDPEYMENYFGWAIELLKNYRIWEQSETAASDKLASVRGVLNKEPGMIAACERSIAALSDDPAKARKNIAAEPQFAQIRIQKRINQQKKHEGKSYKRLLPVIVFLSVVPLPVLYIFIQLGAADVSLAVKLIVLGLIIGFLALVIGLPLFIYRASKRGDKPVVTTERSIPGEPDYEELRLERLNDQNAKLADLKRTVQRYRSEEPIAEQNLIVIRQNLREAKRLLDSHHSIDVVPSANRSQLMNMEALCAFRYYLAAGICDEVTGAHGVYRLYFDVTNDERRHRELLDTLNRGFNTVNANLRTLNSELSEIKDSVRRMEQSVNNIETSVSSIDRNVTSIKGDVREIRTNSEISARANQQTAMSAQYMAGVAYHQYMRSL